MDSSDDDFSLASDSSNEKVVSKKRKANVTETPIKEKSNNQTKKVVREDTKQNTVKKEITTSSSSASPPPSCDGVDITRGPDVTTESAAKALITKYLIQQNRPYSAIQIYENLHKRIQKPTVERCLNVLVESGQLVCKEYGKAKIYFPNQNNFSVVSDNELQKLNNDVNRLVTEIERQNERDRVIKAEITTLSSEPSDSEIDNILEEMENRVNEKEHKIKQTERISGSSDPKAYEKIVKEYMNTRTLWRDRKLQCMEAMEMIADGLGKKVKVVMDELGIETDEDAQCTLPPVIKS